MQKITGKKGIRMDDDKLILFVYLDHTLVKDLHSLVLQGFIESETLKFSII